MKTREQFIERWKRHLAGMALFGAVSERNDGPMARAGKIFELPQEIVNILGCMYDDIGIPKEVPLIKDLPKQAVNGNATMLAKQTTVGR